MAIWLFCMDHFIQLKNFVPCYLSKNKATGNICDLRGDNFDNCDIIVVVSIYQLIFVGDPLRSNVKQYEMSSCVQDRKNKRSSKMHYSNIGYILTVVR